MKSFYRKIFGPEEFGRRVAPNSSTSVTEEENNPRDESRSRRVSGGVLGRGEPHPGVNLLEPSRRRRPRDESYRARLIRFVLWMHKSVEDIACHLERMVSAVYEGQTHEKCPHKDPCFDYWLKVNY